MNWRSIFWATAAIATQPFVHFDMLLLLSGAVAPRTPDHSVPIRSRGEAAHGTAAALLEHGDGRPGAVQRQQRRRKTADDMC